MQRDALDVLYKTVGFARSLLAYELPDGRLKLLDGHLRRDLTPEMEVDVEVLDLTEEEARVLLLSLDPLASLAQTQDQIRSRMEELTPVDSPELQAAWAAAAHGLLEEPKPSWSFTTIPEQYFVLIACRDEPHQIELLTRFQAEGFDCRSLLS